MEAARQALTALKREVGAVGIGFQSAATQSEGAARRIAQGTGAIGAQLRQLQTLATTVLGAALGGATVRSLLQVADGYKSIQARLQLATGSAEAFARAQADVTRISSSTLTSLSSTANLYARLSDSLGRAGTSQRQIASITESVGLALKVTGATATEAASAMLQLSQAFGSGVLRGEEFNAVAEAAPRIMRAVADSLGVNVGQLRRMAEAGELTSEAVGKALVDALSQLRREAAAIPPTVGGAFQVLRNSVVSAVGELDKSTGITNALARAMLVAADNVKVLSTAITGTLVTALATLAVRAGGSLGAAGVAGLVARVGTAFTGPAGIIAAIGLATTAFLSFSQKGTTALQELIDKQRELAKLQGESATTASNIDPQREEVLRLIEQRKALVAEIRELEKQANDPFGGLTPTNFTTSEDIEARKRALQEQLEIKREDLRIGDQIIAQKAVEIVAAEDEVAARSTVTAATDKQQEAVVSLIAALEKETATFGKTEREVAQYEAALNRATAAQRALIDGFFDLREAQNALKESQDKAKEVADSFQKAKEEVASSGPNNPRLANPLTERSVLDVARALDEARAAASKGNGDEALKKAEAARDIIKELSEAGTASKFFLNDLLGQAEQIATGVTDDTTTQQEEKIAELQERLRSLKEDANISVGLDTSTLQGELDGVHEILANREADIPVGLNAAQALPELNAIHATLQAAANRNPIHFPSIIDPPKGGGDGGGQEEAPQKASGGLIDGPGSETSDSILAWLSRGEFVLRAAAVRKYGLSLVSRMNAMNLPPDALPRLAGGGLVLPNIPSLQRTASPTGSEGRMANVYLQLDSRTVGPMMAKEEVLHAVRDMFAIGALMVGGRRR